MEEALEKDLVKRSDICKLFGMRDMSWLDVRQVNQLPAVDVMELPTVQRMQKELVETKARLVSAQLANEGLKAYCLKIMVEKANLALKTKPLVKKKKWAKSHADGIRTNIHIVDEWSAAGPKPTPPREIIPDLKPGAHVVFKTEAEKMFYGNQAFRVLEVEGSHAVICNLTPESAIPRPPETVLFVETKKLAKLSRPETKIFE